jgi:hypothetical protein
VRLTVKNNHGSTEYTELMDFRATGKQLTKTPLPDVSGTYDSSYGKFHIRQQGTSVTGCYESGSGLIEGGVEGRVLTFTWREASRRYGPAIMVFSPDVKQMTGVWWDHNNVNRAGGLWDGTWKSNEVGSCRHWTGGVKEQLTKNLYVRHTKNWIKPQSPQRTPKAVRVVRTLCALCALCGYVLFSPYLGMPSI